MKFEPRNRRLYIRRVGQNPTKKQKRVDGIVLPEDVKFENKGNELYCIVDKSKDVKLDVEIGDYILVEESMVEATQFKRDNHGVEIAPLVFLTVLENYVKGVVSSWDEESKKTT